jgi:hypothetical protein
MWLKLAAFTQEYQNEIFLLFNQTQSPRGTAEKGYATSMPMPYIKLSVMFTVLNYFEALVAQAY